MQAKQLHKEGGNDTTKEAAMLNSAANELLNASRAAIDTPFYAHEKPLPAQHLAESRRALLVLAEMIHNDPTKVVLPSESYQTSTCES